MDNLHVDINRDILNKAKEAHPNASWCAFGYESNGDGTKFGVEIHHPENCPLPSSSIMLSYEALDGYIYALQDLKQKLELLRIKNAVH